MRRLNIPNGGKSTTGRSSGYLDSLYFDAALYRSANYVAVCARLLYRELEGSDVEARIISFRAF